MWGRMQVQCSKHSITIRSVRGSRTSPWLGGRQVCGAFCREKVWLARPPYGSLMLTGTASTVHRPILVRQHWCQASTWFPPVVWCQSRTSPYSSSVGLLQLRKTHSNLKGLCWNSRESSPVRFEFWRTFYTVTMPIAHKR